MSISKKILGRVWALWGLLWFLFTLLIFVWPIVITFLIPEPYGVKIFKAVSKFWMTLFLYGIGCPIRVTGKEHYDPSQCYVVTANHQSLMDVPLLTPFFPGPNKTIAKKSMARIPIFGWVYTRGSVLVDRSSDASRKRSFDAMKRVLLEDKLNMAVYPEGTRNRTGQPLKSFYDGAFRLARDTGKDIIPVIIRNTAKALPPSVPFFFVAHFAGNAFAGTGYFCRQNTGSAQGGSADAHVGLHCRQSLSHALVAQTWAMKNQL